MYRNQSSGKLEKFHQQVPSADALLERSDRRIYMIGMIFAAMLPILSMYAVL